MDAADSHAVVAGMILRVDTDRLRALGGSCTNAQRTTDADRAVTGTHDFLIVAIDAGTRICTALPLYPRSAPGSAQLDPAALAGADDFTSIPLFYSRWQHWRIPLDAFVEAVSAESRGTTQRSYALGQSEPLRDLANWASRNRCEFRPA